MAKLTYFPLLIDRWIAGTQELTFEERGFYISLIVWLYDTGKPIKDSDHAARILRCDKRTSRRLLGKLRPKFRLTSAGLRHRLCDELLRNGGKLKGLDGNRNPLKPDPDPEKKKTPSESKKKVSAQSASTAQGSRLREDWKPSSEDLVWAREEFPAVDLKLETEKFRDHFLSAPGQKGRKVYWGRTWRNWIRGVRAKEIGPRRGNGSAGRPQSFESMVEGLGAQLGVQSKPGESYREWYARLQGAQRRAH